MLEIRLTDRIYSNYVYEIVFIKKNKNNIIIIKKKMI